MTINPQDRAQPCDLGGRSDFPRAGLWAQRGQASPALCLPVPQEARSRLRGARTGTAQPLRLPEPLVVTRRVSIRGSIIVGGQKIQVGLVHVGKTAEVTVEADTYQITV
jgi:hypothetical protein